MQETTASSFASTFAGDSQAKAPRQTYALSFSGSGSEYFKIWIVNVLLSIITLGVYSAWAKVRRLQYFYRNTRLAGASFDYHGEPKAILKGRALAFLLMLAYAVAGKVNPLLGVVLFLLLSVLTPYLLVRSQRFNLSNTSYRGLRFNFVGDQKDAARVFLFYPLLSMLSLGLALPWVNQRTREYMVTHCQYGTRAFRFKATVGDYYRLYLRVVLAIFLLLLVLGVVLHFSGSNWSHGFQSQTPQQRTWSLMNLLLLMLFFGYFAYIALIAVFGLLAVYVRMKLFNLSWNATRLREHRFYSRLEAGPYLWIKISNVLAIICTLGLFIPFAAVRTARYRVEHMGLKTRGDLEAFVAGEVAKSAALGEELAGMMDLDFAL